jgi:hypothetical protein
MSECVLKQLTYGGVIRITGFVTGRQCLEDIVMSSSNSKKDVVLNAGME